MIEQILDHIHNYFIKETYVGNFSIVEGNIVCDFLKDDQYFKIVGSVFNDGVFKYPSNSLKDEDFKGEVWALAVPPALVSLSEEVKAWQDKYGDTSQSPYTSESFGGYSYSKSRGGVNGENTGGSGWQSVFANRLNHWRKLS